jgi:hypothetical protein
MWEIRNHASSAREGDTAHGPYLPYTSWEGIPASMESLGGVAVGSRCIQEEAGTWELKSAPHLARMEESNELSRGASRKCL